MTMTTTMTMVAVSWVLRVAVVLTFALLIDIITAATSVSVDASSDPGGGGGDGACLSLLRSSLEDPNNSLRNWTKQNLAKPCPGFDSQSYLLGATCNNGRIFKLSLSNLYLRGTLSPNSISQCSNLQSLDLSSNSLSGEIPSEIFNNGLLNLAVLNLSSNQFSGPIPPQLSLCTYLNVIDLHNNQLSGSIPQQLGFLARLSVFDVSNNRLSGMIPPSLGGTGSGSPRFNASSFIGNKGLYGYPLDPNYNSNDSTGRNNKGGGLSIMAIVGIGLGSGLLSLLVSFTVVCIWLRISEQKMADSAHHQAGKITHLMPEY